MLLRKVFQLPIMLVVTLIVLMLLLQLAHIGVFVSVSISGLCKAIAIGFFVVGAGIIGVAAIAFKKAKTTLNPTTPEQTSQLVSAGIFALSRNPMYIGFLLWVAGGVIYFGNFFNIVWLPVFVVLANKLYIIPEERALMRLFGTSYTQYQQKVGRWL